MKWVQLFHVPLPSSPYPAFSCPTPAGFGFDFPSSRALRAMPPLSCGAPPYVSEPYSAYPTPLSHAHHTFCSSLFRCWCLLYVCRTRSRIILRALSRSSGSHSHSPSEPSSSPFPASLFAAYVARSVNQFLSRASSTTFTAYFDFGKSTFMSRLILLLKVTRFA